MSTFRALFILTVLALPGGVWAQQLDPQPYRRWEVGGGLGMRFGDGDDAAVPPGHWLAEAARYWTPHVKTSVAVITTRQTTCRRQMSLKPATDRRGCGRVRTGGPQFRPRVAGWQRAMPERSACLTVRLKADATEAGRPTGRRQ